MVGFSPEYKASTPRRQKRERTLRPPSLETPLEAAERVFAAPSPYSGVKDRHMMKGLLSKFPWAVGMKRATGNQTVSGLRAKPVDAGETRPPPGFSREAQGPPEGHAEVRDCY